MASKAFVSLLCISLLIASGLASDAGAIHDRRLLQSGSSSSGSGSSVSTTGSGSGTASSSSSSAVTAAAASACASALSGAFTAGNVCPGGSWAGGATVFAAVEAAAATCTQSIVHVVLSSYSKTTATGSATACAGSSASVQTQASAISIANAAAQAIAQACNGCSSAIAYVHSSAFTSSFVSIAANAYTYACSYGQQHGVSSASAGVYANLHAMAASLASACGQALALACENSCYPSCGSCPWAQVPSSSMTNTYAAIADSKYAVVSGMADAVAQACNDKQYSAHAEQFAELVIGTCLQAYGTLHATTMTKGHSFSCAYVIEETDLEAMASASVYVTAEALADNWGPSCGSVVSTITGSIDATQIVSAINNALVSICSAGGTSADVTTLIHTAATDCRFADALATAWASSDAQCLCNSPGGCCGTCNWGATCASLS